MPRTKFEKFRAFESFKKSKKLTSEKSLKMKQKKISPRCGRPLFKFKRFFLGKF